MELKNFYPSANDWFASDVYSLVEALENTKEKDLRNQRAKKLIELAIPIFYKGGDQYTNLLVDLSKNTEEHLSWYNENIKKVMLSNLVPEDSEGRHGNFRDYPGLDRYFSGLDSDVFEEIQKLLMFLASEDSLTKISWVKVASDRDNIEDDIRNFWLIAHSVFISCLEGGKYLDRAEEIFNRHKIPDSEFNEIIGSIKKSRIHSIASEIIDK